MKKALVTALTALVAAASHASFTVATFADPTTIADSPLFVWDVAGGTISGGWTANGLNLETPGFNGGGVVNNAHFVMDPVAVTPVIAGMFYTMAPGTIKFFTTDPNVPFFTMTFGGGTFLSPFNIGASEMAGPTVDFTGDNLNPNLNDETYSFSLTNEKREGNFISYTASFTSSANAVPEPSAVFFLVPGVLALALGRRKR